MFMSLPVCLCHCVKPEGDFRGMGMGELAGEESVAVAVGVSDRWQVTGDTRNVTLDTWHVKHDIFTSYFSHLSVTTCPFWYRCYYPHMLTDSVSPVCIIFQESALSQFFLLVAMSVLPSLSCPLPIQYFLGLSLALRSDPGLSLVNPPPLPMGDDRLQRKWLKILTLLLLVKLGWKLAKGADFPGDNTHKISAL